MASTVNRYTVRSERHNEPENEEEECKQLPRRFDQLPRDLQGEVLKHTHASFEVAHHMEVAQSTLGLYPERVNGWLRRLPFVPVVLRYEFKLQRRLADGPRMTARFSRSLDPALKQTDLWQTCPRQLQAIIERAAARVLEIEPFTHFLPRKWNLNSDNFGIATHEISDCSKIIYFASSFPQI